MKIEEQKFRVVNDPFSPMMQLQGIDEIARVCYKSGVSPTGEATKAFIKKLIESEHEAMIEHSLLSVEFRTDRAVSHELVRHRQASFAQESQRYCNYSKEKFGSDVSFIRPVYWTDVKSAEYKTWARAMQAAENEHFRLLDLGCTPQEARAVLPNSTATTIVVSANFREWRHILKLRTAENAHPQMRALMRALLKYLKYYVPVIFDDIEVKE